MDEQQQAGQKQDDARGLAQQEELHPPLASSRSTHEGQTYTFLLARDGDSRRLADVTLSLYAMPRSAP
ncbi:hypothetical protein KSF_042850 [Reticulibacter mediterranei]|uniref:Uncharacterized protein n=1 Tax=Reticulibacter mediterranei TaxID=2778369 RepID=A0A8J3N1J8_9CHLR|nr:hypothetical protein [Reticulibacter mediterranei]GHO94237.1 hypothetical protein KSF_042850 [Reticulibacter mediterranei]